MKCTGRIRDVFIDYFSKSTILSLRVNEDIREEYERLKDKEKLSIEVKEFRQKRSLNANAYFHVLAGRLADVLGTSKPYRVYLLLRGSHTYNTQEMSRLIDGTIQDAKEQGIETATPDELRRMKEQWKVEA